MKVGTDVNDDIRRAGVFRKEIGWDNFLVCLEFDLVPLKRLCQY